MRRRWTSLLLYSSDRQKEKVLADIGRKSLLRPLVLQSQMLVLWLFCAPGFGHTGFHA
jgi:hypothetical protein